MYKEIIAKIKPEIDKTIFHLREELEKIRTSRPSVSLIEDLQVDYYDVKTPLKNLAAISVSGPRTIIIQPWDRSILLSIEKTIIGLSMGINPTVEKDVIRLNFPSLSEEYRKELLKILNTKTEEARLTVRHWREDAWRRIQEEFRQGTIREDDKFKAKDDLQKLVDDYVAKIEEMAERKKQEIGE
ncbi:MAG: ribosome recycling factor [bacterium]